MPKTYAEIEDRVLKNINSTTADVSLAVDNAIDFLGNFYENYKIDDTIATVANQDYIDRPALCKEVERLEIDGEEIGRSAVANLAEIKDNDLAKFIEYDGKINLYPTPTEIQATKIWFKAGFTNLAGVADAISDVPDYLIPLLVSIATWFFLEQQENLYDFTGADGWIDVNEDVWTMLSDADAPTFTVTVPTGAQNRYSKGMKIKLVQSTTKYFIITKVTNTVLTLFGGSDGAVPSGPGYVLTVGAISQIKYSTARAPRDFPMNPDKWSISYMDNVLRSQATPTVDVWYNINTAKLNVPLGLWRLKYACSFGASSATPITLVSHVTLSTSNNAATDTEMTGQFFSGPATGALSSVNNEKVVELSAKTDYFINTKTTQPGLAFIYNDNVTQKMIIKAICAYL